MLLRAFAKINLDLRIHGRRTDGYHEVQTVLQTIDWFDELYVERARCFRFEASEGPQDESNLVVRAVRAYERLAGVTADVQIRLVKHVPIGRGLGGGSADAAVMFMGLQRLFKKTLPVEAVRVVLRDLGSDVPFFAAGGRAIGLGRGDEILQLPDKSDYWLVLVDPDVAIATAEAYSWLTVAGKSNSIVGFRTDEGYSRESDSETNDFEGPVFARIPVLKEIKDELLRLGAFRAALSGSGSAIFGQFHSQTEGAQAESVLRSRFRTKLTKPLPRSDYFLRMVDE